MPMPDTTLYPFDRSDPMFGIDDPERMGRYTSTFTGKKFYLFDPRAEEIDILDIAHQLGQFTRFGGACDDFYSVGQHSVLASYLVDSEFALEALLHDASEAYTGDMRRPFKESPGMEVFRQVEEDIMRVIRIKYGLPAIESPEVKVVDNRLQVTEARDFHIANIHVIAEPYSHFAIQGINWRSAKKCFLERFAELTFNNTGEN
jgi:hypothetical protein